MRILSHLGVFVIIGMLAGCMPVSNHQGSDLSAATEFTITKNQTTEQELVDHFGAPSSTSTQADGRKTMTWVDARVHGTENLVSYLPIVGVFTGPGMDMKTTQKSLTATVQNGIVVDFILSDGQSQMKF